MILRKECLFPRPTRSSGLCEDGTKLSFLQASFLFFVLFLSSQLLLPSIPLAACESRKLLPSGLSLQPPSLSFSAYLSEISTKNITLICTEESLYISEIQSLNPLLQVKPNRSISLRKGDQLTLQVIYFTLEAGVFHGILYFTFPHGKFEYSITVDVSPASFGFPPFIYIQDVPLGVPYFFPLPFQNPLSSQNISIYSIETNSSIFEVGLPDNAPVNLWTLSPGKRATVAHLIFFSPNVGVYAGSLKISTSVGLFLATLRYHVGHGQLFHSPKTLDFGKLRLGQRAVSQINFFNI